MNLILASASPRRRQLLKKLRLPFRVVPSHVTESSGHKTPVRFVRQLALRKAENIAKKLRPLTRPSPRGEGRAPLGVRGPVVIGADTVVVLRGKILGKPRDTRHAQKILSQLSGSTHDVYTGVAVVDASTGRAVVSHAKSCVRMKKIPRQELMRLSRRHHDKAGAYAIQERRDPMARVIKGSYENVVGLPVATVRALLKKLSRAV